MDLLRNFSPSFERNIQPITDMLKQVLPEGPGALLEIGSGSGQHASHLALRFLEVEFQPSEYNATSLVSINAWAEHFKLSNMRMAITLDVTASNWRLSEGHFTALTAFNVIHYAPWEATEKLFENAGRYLTKDAQIIFYGPYKRFGKHTSPSNAEFENWLKSKDPEFGIRDIRDVTKTAKQHGFALEALHPMPANNFMPVFKRI